MNPFAQYILGYLFSLVLTFGAAGLVFYNGLVISQQVTFTLLTLLAFLQFLVQLIFFLHLNEEGRGSAYRVVFFATIFMVGILVLGTLWIMQHLEHSEHAQIPFHEGVVTPQTELK
jgi:cytochrome o ubiquinol oxidase subunit IV